VFIQLLAFVTHDQQASLFDAEAVGFTVISGAAESKLSFLPQAH